MDRRMPPVPDWDGTAKNFVFLGEAGCGKSELAVNTAARLAEAGDLPVHFFDLDMTKPLFRSREIAGDLEKMGIIVHFQEQFMDAPTAVGGPDLYLRRGGCRCVLDVGGDYIGARSVGRYAPLFRAENTFVYYVINPYRPWSDTIERIDGVLSDILAVTHLSPGDLRVVGNPNLGPETTAEEFLEGCRMLRETVEPYCPVSFCCAREGLIPETDAPGPLMELKLYFPYPWNE